MLLFVGLGNPDPKHKFNRHNIGFMIIDALNKKFEFSKQKSKYKGLLTYGEINKVKIFLLKPLTFMNLSGSSVQEIMSYQKINLENIFVFHDDLDLNLGKIKCKCGGSSGGHNGINSIAENIGENFNRIRIGINHPGSKHLVDKHVLNDFSADEKKIIEKSIDKILVNFNLLIDKQTDLFSSRVNA